MRYWRCDIALTHSDYTAAAVLNTGMKPAFDGAAVINIYGGTVPADANALNTGTLLAQLTCAATVFLTPAAGARALTAGAIGSATASASGTATYFRVKFATGDSDAAGSAVKRIQGAVGTSGAEMNLNSTTITSGGNVSISSWTYQFPV